MVKHKKKREDNGEEKDTTRIVNNIIGSKQVQLKQLRQIAVVRGLVNHHIRSLAWPMLLCTQDRIFDPLAYEKASEKQHKDKNIVECDVARSLWSFCKDHHSPVFQEKRDSLTRLLNSTVGCEDGQEIYYYQGLHDIASVLLLVVGERKASHILQHLVRHHLRDCTRIDLGPVLDSLELVFPLLEKADHELYSFIKQSGVPAHFAISWRLTWFAHEIKDLEGCARLFDVFIASHPLMPLYVGVASLIAAKHKIFSVECDFAIVHQLLQKIAVTDVVPVPVLIRHAIRLYKEHSPDDLVSRHPTRINCTSVKAYLKDEVWCVPQKAYKPTNKRRGVREAMNQLVLRRSSVKYETWTWFAMLSFSGVAALTTITAATTAAMSVILANDNSQLVNSIMGFIDNM